MIRWSNGMRSGAAYLLLVSLTAWCGLSGCGSKEAVSDANVKPIDSPSISVPATATAANDSVAIAPDALHQSFAKATRGSDDPPTLCNIPPEMTVTEKPVGKLYAEVVRLWDTIRLADAAGKPLPWVATVETDHGVIEIALRADVAPNHVRSFVALAQAGYYDGLRFERARHEEPDASEPAGTPALDLIEGGCPLGTGEAGQGSIGYWLRPEFDSKDQPKLTHDVGTVGACRGEEADSAGCKFYILLSKAPILDGNYTAFGKVTQGLDVARRIWQEPGVEQEADGSRRPVTPIVIKRVTVRVEADKH